MSQVTTETRVATAFSPASVGNISVGFDLLGHAIEGPGDRVRVAPSERPGVSIQSISGCVSDLPRDSDRNTAARAVTALSEATRPGHGFDLWIEKGIPLGSGLGGSAASAVAAVVAANALLEHPLSREQLYRHALEGEAVASGSRHGDNIAPMLFGGISLATSDWAMPLETPDCLWAAVVHPEQVLETRHSRAVLDRCYPLDQVVRHNAHLAQFLYGLWRGDLALIRAGLKDVLVEPWRAPLIPGFAAVREAALAADALGAGISGGGPSLFAWFQGETQARVGGAEMHAAFARQGIHATVYISPVAARGARLL